MKDRDELISALSSNLQSVRPAANANAIALLWLLASVLYVVLITHWFGPIRANALTQLMSVPRFSLEMIVGLAAITLAALAAFRAAIPGALTLRFRTFAAFVMLVWLGGYVLGLVDPTLEPSMLGKRDHCYIETALYALPPAMIACYLCRRLYPLKPVNTALRCGLAAGMIPALYMQVACMYIPSHILLFHIFPGLLIAVLTAAVALPWFARLRL